jgi:hypothetical protein
MHPFCACDSVGVPPPPATSPPPAPGLTAQYEFVSMGSGVLDPALGYSGAFVRRVANERAFPADEVGDKRLTYECPTDSGRDTCARFCAAEHLGKLRAFVVEGKLVQSPPPTPPAPPAPDRPPNAPGQVCTLNRGTLELLLLLSGPAPGPSAALCSAGFQRVHQRLPVRARPQGVPGRRPQVDVPAALRLRQPGAPHRALAPCLCAHAPRRARSASPAARATRSTTSRATTPASTRTTTSARTAGRAAST